MSRTPVEPEQPQAEAQPQEEAVENQGVVEVEINLQLINQKLNFIISKMKD